MKIHMVPVDGLKEYERNARTHSDTEIAELVEQIAEFGWTNPVLFDDRGIVAGHRRKAAAVRIYAGGGTIRLPNGEALPDGCVPGVDVTGWTDAQRRAAILADNKTTLNGGWDLDVLSEELRLIGEADFDLSKTGFSTAEIDSLLEGAYEDLPALSFAGEAVMNSGEAYVAPADREPQEIKGNTEPDEVPEPPAEPKTKPGDVWLLGRHRLICGDSTDADVVAKVLNGAKPHLMVTDPPYGVEYDAGWRNEAMPTKNDPDRWVDGGGRAVGKVENDDRADWREAWALFPGEVAYVWHADNKARVVADSLEACNLQIRAQIIWAKSQFVIGRGHYHPHHKPCWYAVRKNGTGHWQGSRKESTLWQIDKPQKSETGHSTQKPIECMERPIRNNSEPGDGVYEPFGGSGTTIIAGEKTNRIVYAIELSPTYVDVAVKRWQDFTGQQAILESDGRKFNDL